MEASVSTPVVSWKDAAEMKDSVAVVVVSEEQGPAGGTLPSACGPVGLLPEPELIYLLVEEFRIADVLDFHPAHDLPDVASMCLWLNVYTLQTIDFLRISSSSICASSFTDTARMSCGLRGRP